MIMRCTVLLVAVCDALTLKVLETMGKRLVAVKRSRYQVIGEQPFHKAHTFWQISDEATSKALRGAWDVVPILIHRHCNECKIDADKVVAVLDEYVRDLVITGTPHSTEELTYRLGSRLHLDLEDED